MTKIQNRALVTVALIFCTGLVGCALLPPSKDVEKPKGEGYGYVARTYHRDMMHTYNEIELDYWDKNGKRTLIWPTLNEYISIGTNAVLFKGYLVDGPLAVC